jgi:hypothetical protein
MVSAGRFLLFLPKCRINKSSSYKQQEPFSPLLCCIEYAIKRQHCASPFGTTSVSHKTPILRFFAASPHNRCQYLNMIKNASTPYSLSLQSSFSQSKPYHNHNRNIDHHHSIKSPPPPPNVQFAIHVQHIKALSSHLPSHHLPTLLPYHHLSFPPPSSAANTRPFYF